MGVIFLNTDIFREQFYGVLVSCLRSDYKTGHLYFKVDFRGSLNPGSEGKGFQGHVKIEQQIIRKKICASPVGTLAQGAIAERGYEHLCEAYDSGNDVFVPVMERGCLDKG